MTLEQTDGPLRDLADCLFQLIYELTGAQPELRDGWYYVRATTERRYFLYLALRGERVRIHPPNSVVLLTQWDETLAGPDVREGPNWFPPLSSAELALPAENPGAFARGEAFIRQAFALYCG